MPSGNSRVGCTQALLGQHLLRLQGRTLFVLGPAGLDSRSTTKATFSSLVCREQRGAPVPQLPHLYSLVFVFYATSSHIQLGCLLTVQLFGFQLISAVFSNLAVC